MLTANEKSWIRDWVRTQYHGSPPDLIRLSEIHIAAYRVVASILGVEWCERMIKPLVNVAENDFLRRRIASPAESLKHVDRIIHLAEYLTRLGPVPNFDAKVEDLRKKGLEETFYELRVAHELQERGLLVKFVVPSGVKGQDFDLEVCLDLEPLAIEVKCLTNEPVYAEKLLYNRLKKASSQLPRTGRGVIFVMLPSAWMGMDEFPQETTRTVESVFRNHSRVNAICLHWEEWSGGPPYGRYSRFLSAINNSPKVPVADIQTLFQTTSHLPPKGARQFLEVSFI